MKKTITKNNNNSNNNNNNNNVNVFRHKRIILNDVSNVNNIDKSTSNLNTRALLKNNKKELSSKLDENELLEVPCSKKQKVQDWDDIDADDMDNPFMVAEYAVEIFD